MKKENKDKIGTICFVSGRSGGHIIPCLTLAKKYKTKDPSCKIMVLTTGTELDKKLASKAQHIDMHMVFNLCSVPYRRIFLYPKFLIQLTYTFLSSLIILLKNKPQKIISTGSYISIPICIAGKLLGIPIELFELNVIPGKAIAFLSPLSNKIHVCFKETLKHIKSKKCYITGYPVRFGSETLSISQRQAKEKMGINPDKKTILVLGGSQGSRFINELLKKTFSLDTKIKEKVQVIHQMGEKDLNSYKNFYSSNSIKSLVLSNYKNLEYCYQAADLIICRSGAGTLFEIIFFSKKCITIPLQTRHTTHQKNNALTLQKQYPKLVTVFEQKTLEKSASNFVSKVKTLLKL